MTFREAMLSGEKRLAEAGIAEAKTDAWLLLATACRIDRTFYYVHMDENMGEEQGQEYRLLVDKRCERIPLQYITGEQEFMGLRFYVNSSVLVPRQDSETLVEEALKKIRPGMRVMDMCTGSGCILISIMRNVSEVEGYGYDISKQALAVAKENARRNEVPAVFEQSNLFENVTDMFDVIVANPPYIRRGEIASLMPEVSEFEPVLALDGGEDGLFFYRKLVSEGKEYLKDGGFLIVEIGCGQGAAVSELFHYAGYGKVQIIKDLAHNDRVVMGEWNHV